MNKIFINQKFRYLLGVAVITILIEIFSFLNLEIPVLIEIIISTLIVVFIGRDVVISGIKSLLSFRFTNINLLMTVAIIGAFIIGEYIEAAVIVALFAVSETLEDLGIRESQNAIEELVNKTPKMINTKDGKKISIEDVKVDDIYVVKPGETIGLDGIVVEGSSAVEEAAITGEPIPSDKIIKSSVYAGTKNLNGNLTIKVTKEAKNSTLQKIADLTQQALNNKADYQKFIEKFAGWFTPAVLVISILVFIVPVILGGNVAYWFEKAITLLVISCPCALVISTPISVFSAVGNASRKGVLVKGGRFLEKLAEVKAIAFDKTKTLTIGKPEIEDVLTFGGTNKEEVLACASGLESLSEHPLANAFNEYIQKNKISPHKIENFKAVTGRGIKGDCLVCKTDEHIIGNLEFILESKKQVDPKIVEKIREVQSSGKIPVILADSEGIKSIIILSDQIRNESKTLISDLKKLGIKSLMLTGDNKRSAETIAQNLGISEVYADMLPQDKQEVIKQIKNKYKIVAMVGDGVNDSPALGLADIGISMASGGSDIAIESSDIALMNDNINTIPFLVRLGKKLTFTIKSNILFALTTKILAIVFTFLGFTNLAVAIFADVGVTFIVVLLSLRLLKYK